MRPALAMLSISLALASSLARADVVDPPPASCPRGSEPTVSHGGPHCAPITCASTAACSPGDTMRTCTPVGLCIETRTGYGRGGPFTFEAATGECAAQSDCAAGSRCEIRDRCVGPGGSFWVTVGGGVCAALVALLGLLIATFTLASRRGRLRPPR